MSQELDGKVAIITGGANGIGRGTAEVFIAEGAKVVIADVDDSAGKATAAELGGSAAFCHTDVSDAQSLQAVVELAVSRFGALHVMVNNAGIPSAFRRLMDDDLRDFERVMAVDLLGVMAGTRQAAEAMGEGASIINTTSIAGITPGVGLATYRAAKAGVIHFSRCAAIELAERGIRVNVLAPGNISTDINAAFDNATIAARMQPLQSLGSTQDVANAAVFLASDRSRQVTGMTLPVDGGATVGPPPSNLGEFAAKNKKS